MSYQYRCYCWRNGGKKCHVCVIRERERESQVMKTITVITHPERFENVVHRGLHTLEALREAGVPVLGTLWPEAVESGNLTVGEPDMTDGSVTWEWTS